MIVLGVAVVAAIGAVFLVRGAGSRQDAAAPVASAVTPMAGEEVLVALRDVPQGVPLQAGDIGLRLFPEASVSEHFLREAQRESIVGGVTRRPFVQGEPIIAGTVVLPDGHGLFAAQLTPGYRAFAIEIDEQTAAGGFIQPNDRVDVILTTRTQGGAGGAEQVRTSMILENVRVLALDDRSSPQTEAEEGPERLSAKVAVLELSVSDAALLARADEMGNIILTLRGVEAEPPGLRAPSAARGTAAMSQQGGAVRVHAFGNVVSGGGSP